MAYTCNRIQWSLKKEGDSIISNNKDEPWGHKTKWNKPVTEILIPYDSTYMSYLK